MIERELRDINIFKGERERVMGEKGGERMRERMRDKKREKE